MNNKSLNTVIILSVMMLTIAIFTSNISDTLKGNANNVNITKFIEYAKNNQIQYVEVSESKAIFRLKNDENKIWYSTVLPHSIEQLQVLNALEGTNTEMNIIKSSNYSFLSMLSFLFSIFAPILLIYWLMMRGTRSNEKGGGVLNLISGGNQFKKIDKTQPPKNTFKDIAGVEEAIDEVKEIVDYLKNPDKYTKIGAKIPRGVLLCGPPGTGKTLLAKCVAGEAKVPFFIASGSEFVESLVGLGARRVRDLFGNAKAESPAIIFIDELDAIARKRASGPAGMGNEERESTLNQLLVEMDGFNSQTNIIVMAATNIPDALDKAILRPGRFDRKVFVQLPDLKGRIQILQVSAERGNVKISPDVNFTDIARGCPGFSGADLANLINEAAILAAQRCKSRVTMDDLNDARDKIIMGNAMKSKVIDEKTNKLVAYHEAGHAIISLHYEELDPLYKVTIIPRSQALGVTVSLPTKDALLYSKAYLSARLRMLMGGRAAEMIIFGGDNYTTGASNDFEVATSLATNMVVKFGMSDKIGPINLSNDSGQFLSKKHSDDTLKIVEDEIKDILTSSMKDATDILTTNIDKLNLLANSLIEHETLEGHEVEHLMKHGTLPKANTSNVNKKYINKSIIPDIE